MRSRVASGATAKLTIVVRHRRCGSERDRRIDVDPGLPVWALCLFGVDLLIVCGLAAHGGQRRPIG